jgi:uncharacterized alpha/beta hydrolase family protein
MKTDREYINPIIFLKNLGFELPSHITINEKLSKRNVAQYEIIRQVSHDGTVVFTHNLLKDVLAPLWKKETYYKRDNIDNVIDIRYEIGLISLATIYGKVKLPCGNVNGEKQRARVPVKTILIYE